MASLLTTAAAGLRPTPSFSRRIIAASQSLLSTTSSTSTTQPWTSRSFLSTTSSVASAAPPTTTTPSNEVASSGQPDQRLTTTTEQKLRIPQAPNREGTWSKSQQPRNLAMTGPRFEQTFLDTQPQPEAAIELIHKQPVRWVNGRSVSCDGGGGPHGHPRIFINLDKPEIHACTYCGLPYANSHHKKHIESLPTHSYPLQAATADPDRARLPETLSLHGTVEGEAAR